MLGLGLFSPREGSSVDAALEGWTSPASPGDAASSLRQHLCPLVQVKFCPSIPGAHLNRLVRLPKDLAHEKGEIFALKDIAQ